MYGQPIKDLFEGKVNFWGERTAMARLWACRRAASALLSHSYRSPSTDAIMCKEASIIDVPKNIGFFDPPAHKFTQPPLLSLIIAKKQATPTDKH